MNFDAKRRRESFEPVDLFHSHIMGMDAFARGLKVAAALRADGRIAEFVRERYASWDSDLGRKIEGWEIVPRRAPCRCCFRAGTVLQSGRQELLEGIINQVLCK